MGTSGSLSLSPAIGVAGVSFAGIWTRENYNRVPDSMKGIAAWLTFRTEERERVRTPLEEDVSALFRDLRIPVLRYLLSLGLPVDEGEDVAQETFLALFRHLREGKPRDNLRGWVFRVAHNIALKRRRDDRLNASMDDMVEMRHDPRPNPEQQLARKRTNDRLTLVVAALPERDRQCIHLRTEGLTYREIADVLDMSLGAVSQSLTRALTKLSQVIEG